MNSVRRRLMLAAGLLPAGLAFGAAGTGRRSAPTHAVELLVIRHRGASAADARGLAQCEALAAPTCSSVLPLAAAARQLRACSDGILAAGLADPVASLGWHQPLGSTASLATLPDPVTGLSGHVRLLPGSLPTSDAQAGALLVEVDLRWPAPDGGWWRLRERRQVAVGSTQYLDHPALGALLHVATSTA